MALMRWSSHFLIQQGIWGSGSGSLEFKDQWLSDYSFWRLEASQHRVFFSECSVWFLLSAILISVCNCLWVKKLAELACASTPALILSLTQASSPQVENQTCFKIPSRDCAICLAAAGSKSCGDSAAPQSERISSLITDKFTPLLDIKIVSMHYQIQKTGQINDMESIFKEMHLPWPLLARRHECFQQTHGASS